MSVQVQQVDRDEKTWYFSNKVINCSCSSEFSLCFVFSAAEFMPMQFFDAVVSAPGKASGM